MAISMRFLFALYIVVTEGTTTPAGLTVADRLKMTPSAVTVLAVTLLTPGVNWPSPMQNTGQDRTTAKLWTLLHGICFTFGCAVGLVKL